MGSLTRFNTIKVMHLLLVSYAIYLYYGELVERNKLPSVYGYMTWIERDEKDRHLSPLNWDRCLQLNLVLQCIFYIDQYALCYNRSLIQKYLDLYLKINICSNSRII